MGTDLILKRRGEEIANLGRKSFLHYDTDDPIVKCDSIVDNLIREVTKCVGYTPKDIGEVNRICEYLTALIETQTDFIKLLARQQLLKTIIEEPDLTIEDA